MNVCKYSNIQEERQYALIGYILTTGGHANTRVWRKSWIIKNTCGTYTHAILNGSHKWAREAMAPPIIGSPSAVPFVKPFADGDEAPMGEGGEKMKRFVVIVWLFLGKYV